MPRPSIATIDPRHDAIEWDHVALPNGDLGYATAWRARGVRGHGVATSMGRAIREARHAVARVLSGRRHAHNDVRELKRAINAALVTIDDERAAFAAAGKVA